MRRIARHPGPTGNPPTLGDTTLRGTQLLIFVTPFALATNVAYAQQTPAGACLVEKVNQNGQSIGNPDCSQRGDLFRLGGNKDLQFFLVRSTRPPIGTFSLQSANGQFDTGLFLLPNGRIRPFISNASGNEPHSLFNYNSSDVGPTPPS